TPATLVLVGRDPEHLVAACRALQAGSRVTPLRLDLADAGALAGAAAGCAAVVCAAGPFQSLGRGLPGAAVAAGAHWLDIGDDPGWVLPLLADSNLDVAARAAGLAVMPGLSTVPALSGALVRRCHERLPGGRHARVTLVI